MVVPLPSIFFLLITLFFLAGVAAGSFGNVLIFRLPGKKSIGGRSKCMSCGCTLRAFELVPVLSFLLQYGRCRRCRTPLSWQYPLVEIGSGLLFIFALQREAYAILPSLFLALSLWLFLLIVVIDARCKVIPDALSIPLLITSAAYAVASTSLFPVLAPFLGILFFGGQWSISRGTWVGSGDLILAAAIGLLTGQWQIFLIALALSYIIGAVIAVILIISNRKTVADHIAFAPFLALGTFIALFAGDRILKLMFGI